MNISFEPLRFIKNLGYMGIGMLGIFVVIGVIILLTMFLNYTTTRKKKNQQ